jgi:thiamine-phosphate pyrophosphorylase
LSCAIKPNLLWLLRLVVITELVGEGRGHEDVAREALAGGCRAIQMRDKELPDDEFARVAADIKGLCRASHALFFVNDRVEIAAELGADGVHLGVEDMDVASARQALPPGSIIGFSPESIDEAREAVARGADYLGIGPVFGSPTKGDAGEPIGLAGISAYSKASLAPVIGVGGITAARAVSVVEAGASGVAVVRAVTRADDMRAAAAELLGELGHPGRYEMTFTGGQ